MRKAVVSSLAFFFVALVLLSQQNKAAQRGERILVTDCAGRVMSATTERTDIACDRWEIQLLDANGRHNGGSLLGKTLEEVKKNYEDQLEQQIRLSRAVGDPLDDWFKNPSLPICHTCGRKRTPFDRVLDDMGIEIEQNLNNLDNAARRYIEAEQWARSAYREARFENPFSAVGDVTKAYLITLKKVRQRLAQLSYKLREMERMGRDVNDELYRAVNDFKSEMAQSQRAFTALPPDIRKLIQGDHSGFDVQLAIEQEKQGRYTDAAETVRRMLRSKPNDAQSIFMLGYYLVLAGRYSEAIDPLLKSLSLEPRGMKAGGVNNLLGVCYGQLGKYGESARYFQQALAQIPNAPMIHQNLGFTYFMLDNREGLLREYNTLLKLDPSVARMLEPYLKGSSKPDLPYVISPNIRP